MLFTIIFFFSLNASYPLEDIFSKLSFTLEDIFFVLRP